MKSSLKFDILVTAKALELPLWEFEIMEFIKNKNKTVGKLKTGIAKNSKLWFLLVQKWNSKLDTFYIIQIIQSV